MSPQAVERVFHEDKTPATLAAASTTQKTTYQTTPTYSQTPQYEGSAVDMPHQAYEKENESEHEGQTYFSSDVTEDLYSLFTPSNFY